MIRMLLFPLLLWNLLVISQDEIIPLGTYSPPFFAELLDVEILDQNTVFMVGVGGLILMDVTNSSQPSMIGRYDPGNIYIRFYNGSVQGNLAVGAARYDGLFIIDISSMSQPVLLNQHSTPNFSYESVDIYQQYLYGAAHQQGIEILSVQNPAYPYQVNLISNLSNSWDVYVDSTILYVADGNAGLKIFSLTDPVNPQFISEIQTSGLAREVICENDIAYVALGSGGFDIIDVHDPLNPIHLSNFATRFGIVNHLAFSNNYIFAATWELVMAVNVSNPVNPVLVATEDTPVRAMGVAAFNDYVYVSDWSRLKSYIFTDYTVPDFHGKPRVYDFGYQGPHTPVSMDFEIFNLGESTLQISNISGNHPQFQVSLNSLQILAGESSITTVTFIPTSSSPISSQLSFQTNDPDEQTATIPIFAGGNRLNPGDPAPSFNLQDLEGNWHSLDQYSGKTVILAFFASW